MNRKISAALLGMTILLGSTKSYALDVQLFRPNFDQQGGIAVQNAQTLPEGFYLPSIFLNWVKNPIEFGTTTGDRHFDTLIGWFMTADVLFATAINDDFSIGLDLPFNVGNKVEGIAQFQQNQQLGLGDLMLYAKYRLRQKAEGERAILPAIAVIPFFSLPTGTSDDFFGNKTVTGGFRFAFDWRLAQRHYLTANLGARLRQEETILNLTVGQELLASAGYRYNLSTEKKWDLLIELFGSTTFKKFASQEISSPVEVLLGIEKIFMDDRLKAKVGVGQGINNGYGAPDIRIFAGATYVLGERKEKVEKPAPAPVAPPPPPPPVVPVEVSKKVSIKENKIIIVDKVYFATGKSVILDKSKPILNDVVTTLKANPQITQISVDGYTDSQGKPESNLKLSNDRANSVRDYLIKEGIEPSRLIGIGHGQEDPVDTNDTPKGRENNRRVEFNIIDPTQ